MAEQFTAIVEPHEKMRGLEVPPEVVEALGGGKRPRVVVTIGGHSWRTSSSEKTGATWKISGPTEAHAVG